MSALIGRILAEVGGLTLTDVHLEEDEPVMARTPAGLKAVDMPRPSRDDLEELLSTLDTDWKGGIRARAINRPYDAPEWPDARLRINGYLIQGGTRLAVVIRRQPRAPLPLDKTGLPASVRLLTDTPRGMILVAGPTQSGKSTTLAAMLDAINHSRSGHVVTVEDPIEYLHQRDKCIFSQREIGADCASFHEGIKDALRQSPDVIMVGEIRDRDTAEAAILAAESGHQVLASLHANSAVSAIHKLLSYSAPGERHAWAAAMSGYLVGVIAQVLLPSVQHNSYVLASELLFNHKGQMAGAIAKVEGLAEAFERMSDGVSRQFEDCLLDLVKTRRVSQFDAMRCIGGKSALYDKLKQVRP